MWEFDASANTVNESMQSSNSYITAHYCDKDDLDSALTKIGLALDVPSDVATPLNVEIGFRPTQCARVLSVSGDPLRVVRGLRQVSCDDGGFLSVSLQRTGHSLCNQRGQQQLIRPGEITVWHGRQSLTVACQKSSISCVYSYLSSGSRACCQMPNFM